jgi:hypothetical protein
VLICKKSIWDKVKVGAIQVLVLSVGRTNRYLLHGMA